MTIGKVEKHFDGVFLSNGPGDPTHAAITVQHLQKVMNSSQVPIMAICMGHQLLALAAGAKTIKMTYGNRAHNIPAMDLTTGKCAITSQNHGYAVDASTLPSDFKEYFVNLNDHSNEGIIHRSRPIFSTQFHPEAKGGPTDCSFLFEKYLDSCRLYKSMRKRMGIDVEEGRPNKLYVDMLPKGRVDVDPTYGMMGMMRKGEGQQVRGQVEGRAAKEAAAATAA